MIGSNDRKIPLEDDEQAAVIRWAEISKNKYPELRWLFHVPNGGARDAITGARLKRLGVKKGVSDLLLLVPKGKYHGLCVEMKRTTGGRLSKEQHDFLQYESERGYRCHVAYGAEDAIRKITEYLEL